jgi:hypothetical protein
VAIGLALTYVSGLLLTLEERIFFGSVIGLMAVTLACLLTTQAFGMGVWQVTLPSIAVAIAAAVVFIRSGRVQFILDVSDFRSRLWARPGRAGNPLPLFLLLVITWGYLLHFVSQLYVIDGRGLVAGFINIWGDWSAHLSFAGSFAYGQNQPPTFFIDTGHRLTYPFGIDFLAGVLVTLGSTLPNALVISSGAMLVALPGVMYCAIFRLTDRRAVAVLAPLLFMLQGGIGFFDGLGRVFDHGLSAAWNLPYQLDNNQPLGYHLPNPVLAYLLPQRSVLFGISIVLIGTSLLWMARRDLKPKALLFVGTLVGLTPLFHVHGYATVVALAAMWAVWSRDRRWWVFFPPAVLLAVPVLVLIAPDAGASSIHWMVGWEAFLPPGAYGTWGQDVVTWIWFWFKNLAFFPILFLAAMWWKAIPRDLRQWLAPIWLWFLVPNVVAMQTWDWDNTKFFTYWCLFGCVLVAYALVLLWDRVLPRLPWGVSPDTWTALAQPRRALVVFLILTLTLSGAFDLATAINLRINQYSNASLGGMAAAAWVRDHTDPKSVFVTAPDNTEPIMELSGRRVVVGFPGWIWSYGDGFPGDRVAAVATILQGRPGTDALLKTYNVSYVVIGPIELGQPNFASLDYWNGHGQVVYLNSEYEILKVNPTG